MPFAFVREKDFVVESHREGYIPGGKVLLFPYSPRRPWLQPVATAVIVVLVGLLVGLFVH